MRDRETGPRSGQVVVTFTVAIVVLCALAVLAIDMGHVMFSQARMQNAADSASLAALLELWKQRADGEQEKTARARAEAEAEALVEANYPECEYEITWGYWIDGGFSLDPSDDNGDEGKAIVVDSIKVRAYRDDTSPAGPTPTFFGSLFGLNAVQQAAQATAHYRHDGLVPLAVDENTVVSANAGDTITLYDETETVPGNCGILDFNGGKNSAEEAKEWMYSGYSGPFEVDADTAHILSEGSPGLKSVLKQPIQYHINEGDVVTACVYSNVTPQGANATYEIVGYTAVRITALQMDDKNQEIVSVDAETAGRYVPGTGMTDGSMRDFMRLELVK